jgi:hypothetical protein
VAKARLDLSRSQILAFRRRVGALDERLPAGPDSLRLAAWAGLQDSMPRAALLSIHARVEGATPSSWEDPALVQVWGPRFAAYVVPAQDHALFTLSRLSDDEAKRRFAEDLASRLHAHLAGRKMTYGEAGRALGVHPNALRYAAPTGTVLIRWEGARQPTIWTVPRPGVTAEGARLELARRYIHIFGPTTPDSFTQWLGIRRAERGRAAFEALRDELSPVRTPIGDAWILSADEEALRAPNSRAAPARLIPSGDTFFLLWGRDREVLVPDAARRNELWTPRVWPGALLVDGEVAGVWRRADRIVSVQTWRPLSAAERDAVVAEAESLPLPGVGGSIVVRWDH